MHIFCLTNITGFNASSRRKIKYPNLRSAMRPVPHSDDLPVPTPPVNKDLQWLQACQNVEDASTRPILSATCVGTSQQLHSAEPSLPSSELPTFTILTVKLVIRTSLGLHTSVVNPATMN